MARSVALAGFALLHARAEHPELLRVRLAPDWRLLGRVVKLGIPAASQTTAEVGVFTAATLLAGRLDAVSLAAHQIEDLAALEQVLQSLVVGRRGHRGVLRLRHC